jgi:magnesium-transporting ATPase (P-type)
VARARTAVPGEVHDVPIHVLIGAAVVTGVLQHLVDAGEILSFFLAHAVIGFVREGRADAAMAAIRSMLAPHAALLRDGHRPTVHGADPVPGDIVLLEAGDKALRICECWRRGAVRHKRRS